ncbi:aromatic amino acid aminotransferase [Gordoniibacillus kamchatkensis]|uniref:Aminotransferase n=1 Tax=Gordoniibacillus kamchatkensis TaxID=1590651 RepID=A0ABR5ADM7_9BACL|nr:aminotransferase A [Paenibacillus sp. VKM B-2647]KIL39133.1 aromatic amino acid aminotransferase [Paenibacillus sp. VKM B-2647]
MEHLINKQVLDIQVSNIRKFSEMAAKYDDVITFAIGQPDFATPEHVKASGKLAIDRNRTEYTTNAGLPELRQAAARFVSHKYGLNYIPDHEIIVTTGASQGIDIAFRTILSEGDEVILPSPVYPGYEPLIKLCGAIPVYFDTTEDQFRINPDRLKNAITTKTRCIVIPSPNPTGITFDAESLERLAESLQDKEIFLLSDEIYSELTYEGRHHSIAAVPSMREKTIVINGLSKSHSMTGWRIGLTFAPAYLTKQMIKVHQYSATCASSISQHAAIEALTTGMDDALSMKDVYRKKRDYAYGRLTAMGFDAHMPNGAFYIFPSVKKFNASSFDFSVDLLQQEHVAVVPGVAFSPYGEGFVRISYACSMDDLKTGLDRIERYVRSLD